MKAPFEVQLSELCDTVPQKVYRPRKELSTKPGPRRPLCRTAEPLTPWPPPPRFLSWLGGGGVGWALGGLRLGLVWVAGLGLLCFFPRSVWVLFGGGSCFVWDGEV